MGMTASPTQETGPEWGNVTCLKCRKRLGLGPYVPPLVIHAINLYNEQGSLCGRKLSAEPDLILKNRDEWSKVDCPACRRLKDYKKPPPSVRVGSEVCYYAPGSEDWVPALMVMLYRLGEPAVRVSSEFWPDDIYTADLKLLQDPGPCPHCGKKQDRVPSGEVLSRVPMVERAQRGRAEGSLWCSRGYITSFTIRG